MHRSIVSLARSLGFRGISPQQCPSKHLTIASSSDSSHSRLQSYGSSQQYGDRLILRGLKFHGKHGVYEEERRLGQKFEIDLDAWLDLSKAGETDQLEHSVSYADIYRRIKSIVEGPSHLLLESVATAIAIDVLEQYPKISDVRVRVGKPHVAVEGVVDLLGVEIFRSSSCLGQSVR